jgi:hypothetical protein
MAGEQSKQLVELYAALQPNASLVTPFEINVPQSALDDLKRRLEMTRWPNRETVSDWSQGVP